MLLRRVEFTVRPMGNSRPIRNGGEGVSLSHRYIKKEDRMGWIVCDVINPGTV